MCTVCYGLCGVTDYALPSYACTPLFLHSSLSTACKVPSSFVTSYLSNVAGFQFSSDKSLTVRVPVDNSSFLVANARNLTLTYDKVNDNDTQAACAADLHRIEADAKGCVWAARCGSNGATPASIEVGCGSLACEGCVLKDFFAAFQFGSAVFT